MVEEIGRLQYRSQASDLWCLKSLSCQDEVNTMRVPTIGNI